MAVPTPVTKEEYAYAELRGRILDGRLQAGTPVRLRTIAEDLGLSPMPVREALRRLQEEGLIFFESHRGFAVTNISPSEVLEGISLRMWIEVLAVGEAATRHTATSLRLVRKCLTAEAAWVASDRGGTRFASGNREFHDAIEAPAGALMRSTIDHLWTLASHARRSQSVFTVMPSRRAAAHTEHIEIFEAVESGDVEIAQRAMSKHRVATLEAWMEVFANEQAKPKATPDRTRTRGGPAK